MLKIGLICGGPSQERGISLNSARSLLDHLASFEVELSLFYVNPQGLFYSLTPGQLYSNTPADFDFKLVQEGKPIESISALQKMDLIFPAIHGAYGEDGTLQALLEEHHIPFVGSGSQTCRTIFHKQRAKEQLRAFGFEVLPSLLIKEGATDIEPFWALHCKYSAVLKPAESGSSIGVRHVFSVGEAKRAAIELFESGFRELLLEPYCEGIEFTLCVLEGEKGIVSLLPTEIEIQTPILDYRKKYLPNEGTRYHCPPRFGREAIARIRSEGERLFEAFALSDFARIDGWMTQEGRPLFSDLNPISGMEQNSFLFQQAAQLEMSHADLLEEVINSALRRYGMAPLRRKVFSNGAQKQNVYVLMGGATAEKQVSLMSGTNAWLKIGQQEGFEATPFLMEGTETLWELPYAYTLHHTVEEMIERCRSPNNERFIWVETIRSQLSLPPRSPALPHPIPLSSFIEKAQKEQAFVFLGLHGGIGEDGTLQRLLERANLPFNGSKENGSRRCMDKYATAKAIEELRDPDLLPLPQFFIDPKSGDAPEQIWHKASTFLRTEELLIKPRSDGCSTGVARLASPEELSLYLEAFQAKAPHLPPATLRHHPSLLEMPQSLQTTFLLEPFIHTDKIHIEGITLRRERLSGWCEMTIGILEEKGCYRAMNPSLTVAQHGVLSLEEKFQGGTGVNLTPPPDSILSPAARQKVQASACKAAKALGIENYARLDLFVECSSGIIRVIEANTLPALTPSTVLYQQALAEAPPLAPKELLAKIITSVLLRKSMS